MAKCKWCERSGWLLRVNEFGLCPRCTATEMMQINRHAEIMLESLQIVQDTKNVSTKLSRIGVAEKSCIALLEYEKKGIQALDISPRKIHAGLQQARDEAVQDEVGKQVAGARERRDLAATDAGKLGGYARAIKSLTRLADEFPDVLPLGAAILALRAEMDAVRFDLLVKKAEVQEAKGRPAKAIEHLIEAIMALKHDATPDHLQGDLVEKARRKIIELGGEPPMM